jgi:hypothetical protein
MPALNALTTGQDGTSATKKGRCKHRPFFCFADGDAPPKSRASFAAGTTDWVDYFFSFFFFFFLAMVRPPVIGRSRKCGPHETSGPHRPLPLLAYSIFATP